MNKHARWDEAALAFQAAPLNSLRPSSRVDLLHLVALGKPCSRFPYLSGLTLEVLVHWAGEFGFESAADEAFIVLAREAEVAAEVLALDRAPGALERARGLRYGYPRCCCEALAIRGESDLDLLASEAASWSYEGEYLLTNPGGYLRGASLICHVPCSAACPPSAVLALQALSFVRGRTQLPEFATWREWERSAY